MKINREKSKTMVKCVSAILLAGMISMGSNVALAPGFESYCVGNDTYLETHFDMQKRNLDYLKSLSEADYSEFDSNFVHLYRNGKISIPKREKEYDISDLYVITGNQNNNDKIFLVSYQEGNIDIITGETIVGFEREGIMLFKNSECFYQFYQACLSTGAFQDGKIDLSKIDNNEILNIMSSFDGSIHEMVPETKYSEKIKKR